MKKILFIFFLFVPVLTLADNLCKLPQPKIKEIAPISKQGIAIRLGRYELFINEPTKIVLLSPEIFYFNNNKKIAFQQLPSEATQSLYNEAFSLGNNQAKNVKHAHLIRSMFNIDCHTQLTQYKISAISKTIIRVNPTIAGEKPAYIYLYGDNNAIYLIEFYNFTDSELEQVISTLTLK